MRFESAKCISGFAMQFVSKKYDFDDMYCTFHDRIYHATKIGQWLGLQMYGGEQVFPYIDSFTV